MDGTFVTKTEEKGRKAGEEEKGNKKGKKIGSKTRKERKEKSAVDSIAFIPRRKDSEEWCGGEKWRKTKGREKRGARKRRLGRWKRAVKGKKRGGKGRKKGGKGRGEKEKGAWRVCIFFFLFFFFIHLTITHRSYSLQTGGEGGQGASVDYEDVALFSDEKKYVALIKSDADSERNYGGCATRWVHLGPRVFTEQPVFRLFLFPFSVSLPPSRGLFPISRFACRDFGKIVTRFFRDYSRPRVVLVP